MKPDEGKNNLSEKERNALTQLRNNNDIVIKEADKGSCIVIMKKSDYIIMCNKILDDSLYYEKLNYDPHKEVQRNYNKLIEELELPFFNHGQ